MLTVEVVKLWQSQKKKGVRVEILIKYKRRELINTPSSLVLQNTDKT